MGAENGRTSYPSLPVPPRHGHRPDHRPILAPLTHGSARARIDAVVVPSRRPPEYLRSAVALAEAIDVPLVVITSDPAFSADLVQMMAGVRGAVVPVPPGHVGTFFGLRIAGSVLPLTSTYADTAAKRNLALKLARVLGWHSLLFLDDDVRSRSGHTVLASEIPGALGGMRSSGLRAVGWALADFPDNSVVCHLRREVGLPQGIFIGGGALLVDLVGDLPFFPPVYNEDWLFLHDWVVRGSVAWAGTVGQVAFDPLADPQRPQMEEFGDVLAEGLYELVHRHWHVDAARSVLFWQSVLAGRAEMLAEIHRRLPPAEAARKHHVALASARSALAAITPGDLADVVRRWRADLEGWNRHLDGLPGRDDLGAALTALGLTDFHLAGG